MVACICHSPLHHQKPDFEGQSVIKASSYLLPFVLEAHRESLPRSCETSARRLSAESAEVYSTADLSASAAHIPFSEGAPLNERNRVEVMIDDQGLYREKQVRVLKALSKQKHGQLDWVSMQGVKAHCILSRPFKL